MSRTVAATAVTLLYFLGALVTLCPMFPGSAAASPVSAADDEISVSATVDADHISLDDQLILTVTVDGATRGVEVKELPRIDGLSLVSGPNIGQQSSFSMVNGRFEQKSTLSHTYVLLPEREGTVTIPSLQVTYADRVYHTGDLRVTVTASSPGVSGQRAGRSRGTRRTDERLTRKILVRALAGKRQIYQGEGVTLEFRVYTQFDVAEFGFQKDPGFEGFWVERVESQPRMKQTSIEGERFGQFTAYRYVLYPTSAGIHTIDSQTMGITVTTSDRFSFFDRHQQVFRRTEALDIEVLPLPDGAPESFNGAVGNYRLNAALGTEEVRTGDVISLELTISGSGNLRGISSPQLPPLPDFKVYDPEVREEIRQTTTGLQGKKIWEYVLVPRAPGDQKIPPITFSYFSPDHGRYDEISTDSMAVRVEKSEDFGVAPGSDGEPVETVAKKSVEAVEQDIRFIHAAPTMLSDQARHRHRTFWFATALIIPVIANLLALVFVRARRRSPEMLKVHRRRKALKSALAGLNQAKKVISESDPQHFYNRIDDSLRRFLADKLGQPGGAGLTVEWIRRILRNRSVDPDLVRRMLDLLERCDFARFSNSSGNETSEMREVLKEGRVIIRELDRYL